VVHLRIVAPGNEAQKALELLTGSRAVVNVVYLPGLARKPEGDMILCDVARQDASVIMEELRQLGIARAGSISLEPVETQLSDAAEAAERVPELAFGDAVVWEEVEARTSEETSLSINFIEFMMIAALIAAVGILLDSPILIVGAMVVGPEFGPVAGFCVAVVQRRGDLARRSGTALAVGIAAAVAATVACSLLFKWTGIDSNGPGEARPLTEFISNPDFFSFFVAYLAGTAGVLSLTSAKSGALIGVLISVTTIPAIANIGVATAYTDWAEVGGAAAQLGVNLVALVLGGLARLAVQRRAYEVRLKRHLSGSTPEP
jgi:uncharacterized hydrophobic protein (TIGR00271 family)